jgi:hypothetical protein
MIDDKYTASARQFQKVVDLFEATLSTFGQSREMSIAKTKLDEVELWTLRHLACRAKEEEQSHHTQTGADET